MQQFEWITNLKHILDYSFSHGPLSSWARNQNWLFGKYFTDNNKLKVSQIGSFHLNHSPVLTCYEQLIPGVTMSWTLFLQHLIELQKLICCWCSALVVVLSLVFYNSTHWQFYHIFIYIYSKYLLPWNSKHLETILLFLFIITLWVI